MNRPQTADFETIKPTRGVVCLSGFGIKVFVDKGHLVLEDGIGTSRRHGRYAKVGHDLRRVVVIGADGFISLGALRWLADRNASFIMLDRVGEVLATTGPVRSSDARLRRAQALAHQSGIALEIARSLVQQKLVQQERILRERFHESAIANLIEQTRSAIPKANSNDEVRRCEAVAAKFYWSAWRSLSVNYPKNDLPRVPDHWKAFGTRQSPLTGSPRRAVNPPNAMLNFLYSLLESESRLALSALGLDPGLGVFHADTPNRDSLACDLMEAVRPLVDIYVHDWITTQLLRRTWLFEERDGNCRLVDSFIRHLLGTAHMWQCAVAPYAEWIARTLWKRRGQSRASKSLATPLTQARRRIAQGADPNPPTVSGQRPLALCVTCGGWLKRDANYCARCAKDVSRSNLLQAAKVGRIAAQSPQAASKRAVTQKRQHALREAWKPKDKPEWLDEHFFCENVLPSLARTRAPEIASALRVSLPYATEIRRGNRIPHPRHWEKLTRLVWSSSGEQNQDLKKRWGLTSKSHAWSRFPLT
jgi:CRISPR-associated endonuclease Cas1